MYGAKSAGEHLGRKVFEGGFIRYLSELGGPIHDNEFPAGEARDVRVRKRKTKFTKRFEGEGFEIDVGNMKLALDRPLAM